MIDDLAQTSQVYVPREGHTTKWQHLQNPGNTEELEEPVTKAEGR